MTQGIPSAIFFAALGAVLFSAKAVVVKLSYQYGSDAATVLALRMLFAMPFFWVAAAWNRRRHGLPPIGRQDRVRLLALGFIGYYVSSYLDFWGLEYISVGLERIILYLNPTMVLLISALLMSKKISRVQWVAMAVAYAGVVLVFLHDIRFEGGAQVALGGTLVFLCAASYAVYLIMAGEIVSRVGSIRTVAYASTSAMVCCVLHAMIANPQSILVQPGAVYGLAVFNAFFCTFVPMLLVMMAVNRVGSGITAQAGAVGPVATVFLGWYFLGEPIHATQIVGMAVVLVSVAILLTVNKPQRPELSEAE